MMALRWREGLAICLVLLLITLAYNYVVDFPTEQHEQHAALQEKLYWSTLGNAREYNIFARLEDRASTFINEGEEKSRMQGSVQRQERLTEHEAHSSGDHGDEDEDKHSREGGQYLSKDLLNRQVQYSPTDFKKAVYRIKTRLLKSLQDEHWIRNSVMKHLQASFDNRGRSKELKDDSSILGNVEDVFAQFNLERAFSAAFKTHENKKRAHSQVDESSASNEETSIARTGESETSQQQKKRPREGYLVNVGLATTRSSWSPAALAAAFFEIATTPYEESAIGDIEVRQTSFAPLASGSLSQALMDYELPLWEKVRRLERFILFIRDARDLEKPWQTITHPLRRRRMGVKQF